MTQFRQLTTIAILFGGCLLLTGCGGGDAPADTSSQTTSSGSGTAGASGASGTSGMPGGAGAGMPGAEMAGTPGGAGGAAPAAGGAAGGGPADPSKPRDARVDPFKPWWDTNPPPPVQELVGDWRIATYESVLPEPERRAEVQEVPDRRVAGILTGNGSWALLDGPDGQAVVKPGDMVGEYRVDSINQDSVVLKRKVGNRTFTQVVPLSDAGSSPTGGAPAGGGVPGGFLGGRPGGGILPGAPAGGAAGGK